MSGDDDVIERMFNRALRKLEMTRQSAPNVAVVEVRCSSVDDLRRMLGIVANEAPRSGGLAFIPGASTWASIPVLVDPRLLPGQVQAFDADGNEVLRPEPMSPPVASPLTRANNA